jgi:6-phosphogluconolactonase
MEEAGMANNYYDFISFASSETLVEVLYQKIINILADSISEKGFANLAVSGGSTPKKLFNKLSRANIDWEKVRVTLVDERWVDKSSEMSNEKLVRDNLLINGAKKATFYGLKTDELLAKNSVSCLGVTLEKLFNQLDVVVLGMGIDGHTASFFPHSAELEFALNTRDLVCATTATVEPKERITLSRNFLLSTQNLFLHIEGKEKKEVFLNASKSDDILSMPIISMMQQQKPLLEVYYAD